VQDKTFSSFFYSSASSRPGLRIGVLLDDVRITRAHASVIEDIQASDFARIELLVYSDGSKLAGAPHAHRVPFLLRVRRLLRTGVRHQSLGWALYTRIDRWRARLENDPLEQRDCSAILKGIATVRLPPRGGGVDQRAADDAIATVRDARLDVLVRLGTQRLSGEILDSAKYGVWGFRYGDSERYRGGPSYFWELVEDDPVSGVALERLAEDPDGVLVLARGFFATDMGSYARNRVQPLFGSTHMVIQKLHELHGSGWDQIANRSVKPAPHAGRRSVYRHPSPWELMRWMGPRLPGRVLDRLARRLHERLDVWHWRVAIRSHNGGTLDSAANMSGFDWIEAPPGHMYADPFIASRAGLRWLFFEDLSYAENRAVISCAPLTPDGRVGSANVILRSAGHISYPYVFFDGPTPYMIPETAAEGSVRLYRATDFPSGWELHRELYSGAAMDTSAWSQDGKWWFFTTLREPRGRAMMLVLFYSDALDGPWVFHPMNPISLDVRNVRGAGAIYRQGRKVVRPSQDCSKTYGYSFTLFEILTLSPTEYRERALVTIRPDWDPDLAATHTYNHDGPIEVIDGKTRRTRSQVI
jgi:hypothetical protein